MGGVALGSQHLPLWLRRVVFWCNCCLFVFILFHRTSWWSRGKPSQCITATGNRSLKTGFAILWVLSLNLSHNITLFFLFAYCNKNTQSTVVAVWSVQFSEEAEVFQVWCIKSWWVFPLKMSFLSLCENEQFIIYPAWCFLALLFVGDSTGVNGLNVECQQPGEYSGDSKCLFFIDDRKSAKQKMYLV